MQVKSFDSVKLTCRATAFVTFYVELDPTYTRARAGSMYRTYSILDVVFSLSRNKIDTYTAWFPDRVLGAVYELLDTPKMDDRVCLIMEEKCPSTWAANQLTSRSDCMERLRKMPVHEGPHFHVDGPSKGCLYTHSVLAYHNQQHCPHISLPGNPITDINGEIKCQNSSNIIPGEGRYGVYLLLLISW